MHPIVVYHHLKTAFIEAQNVMYVETRKNGATDECHNVVLSPE